MSISCESDTDINYIFSSKKLKYKFLNILLRKENINMAYNDKNYVAGVKVPYVHPKEITEKRVKILESRIQQIKDACAKLKSSSVSKNDALKMIKNICNTKDEEEKMWKDLLGNEIY